MWLLAAPDLLVGLFQTHVQQRIRLAHTIDFRASDDFEALLEIEAQGLRILFIDVQLIGIQMLHGVVQQLFTQALAAVLRPATRRAVREMIEAYGAFIEVHVATSIEECERRDRKGLYKLAREGKIKEFTGISDPYEAPTKAELVVNTEGAEVDYCAQQVILKLESMGLIKG